MLCNGRWRDSAHSSRSHQSMNNFCGSGQPHFPLLLQGRGEHCQLQVELLCWVGISDSASLQLFTGLDYFTTSVSLQFAICYQDARDYLMTMRSCESRRKYFSQTEVQTKKEGSRSQVLSYHFAANCWAFLKEQWCHWSFAKARKSCTDRYLDQ